MVTCRLTDARAIATANNHRQRQHQHQHQHQHYLHQQQLQSQQSLLLHQHHQSEQHQQLLFQHEQKNQQQHLHNHQHRRAASPLLQQLHPHEPHQPQQQQIHYRNTGSISTSQVPLQKNTKNRVSYLTSILIAVLHWIWPPDRCNNCQSIYSSSQYQNDKDDANNDSNDKSFQPIKSLTSGGCTTALFNAITEDDIDADDGLDTQKRNSRASSSSDDGGFLSRHSNFKLRSSWRRPLVGSSNQSNLQSSTIGSTAKGLLQSLGGLLKIGSKEDINARAFYQNVYQPPLLEASTSCLNLHTSSLLPQPQQHSSSLSSPGFINTISGSLSLDHATMESGERHVRHVFSPSKVSRIFSSLSTSTRNNLLCPDNDYFLSSPWTLVPSSNKELLLNNNLCTQFSEISSLNYTGSTEKSILPLNVTPINSSNRYRCYSHELPALRTIEEETRRMNFEQQQKLEEKQQQQKHRQPDFVPLQIHSPTSLHNYCDNQETPYYYSYRPQTLWYPRHYSRLFERTQSELLSPLPHLNLSLRGITHVSGLGLDISPESRSSSSGFGSKNTSNIPQGSHHSGSTTEWRLLPPYRPPPPPPNSHVGYFSTCQFPRQSHQSQQAQAQVRVMSQEHTKPQTQLCSFSNYLNLKAQSTVTPPYTMERWLTMIRRLNNTSDHISLKKAIDVGSVDGHYEFDPSTPTSSASTPTVTELRDDLNLNIETAGDQLINSNQIHHHPHSHRYSTQIYHENPQYLSNNTLRNHIYINNYNKSYFQLPNDYNEGIIRPTYLPISNHQNINYNYRTTETRLQAVREEFYEYRKRQAMRWAAVPELETVC